MLAMAMMLPACRHDRPQDPCSFTEKVQPIINSRCAVQACHDGSSALADFREFEALKSRAENGRIRRNVLELQIMPPASAIPLTEYEKDILRCWLDGGAKDR